MKSLLIIISTALLFASQLAQAADEVPNGPYTRLHPNGQKAAEGSFLDGELTGKWTRWNEAGQKIDEGSWKEGAPEGVWTRWYDDGKLKERGTYLDGRRVCEWSHWNAETGELTTSRERQAPECLDYPDFGSRFSILRFRVASSNYFQPNGGTSYTGLLSWNPEFHALRWLSFRAGAGASLLSQWSAFSFFPSFESLISTVFTPNWTPELSLAIGLGAEFWIGNGGFAPLLDVDLDWRFKRPVLSIFDRVFVGYSIMGPIALNFLEVKLGLGISLSKLSP